MFGYWSWDFWDDIENYELEYEEITTNQATAIRDWKLDEFIKWLI